MRQTYLDGGALGRARVETIAVDEGERFGGRSRLPVQPRLEKRLQQPKRHVMARRTLAEFIGNHLDQTGKLRRSLVQDREIFARSFATSFSRSKPSSRQKALAVNIPYRGSTGPLHLLIDSTGIKAEGEGEWHARKHGGPKRRLWRKIHLGIDEETLEVRAVEITGSHVGDAPMLPELLNQISTDEEIGSVTADGAYDTRKCHDAVADRGAHAVIPPRKNAKPWKPRTAGALARNEALRASKYLGRSLWRHWSGYHRRSRVETKMHCVKLLGQSFTARDFDRQVAEIQIRIAVLNGFTALGIPVTEAVG